MTRLNKHTTKAQACLNAYYYSDMETLYDAYDKTSQAKRQAFQHCIELMHKMQGFNGKITARNSFGFSYGFEYCDCDGVVNLCYITKDNIYTIEE